MFDLLVRLLLHLRRMSQGHLMVLQKSTVEEWRFNLLLQNHEPATEDSYRVLNAALLLLQER